MTHGRYTALMNEVHIFSEKGPVKIGGFLPFRGQNLLLHRKGFFPFMCWGLPFPIGCLLPSNTLCPSLCKVRTKQVRTKEKKNKTICCQRIFCLLLAQVEFSCDTGPYAQPAATKFFPLLYASKKCNLLHR